MHASCGGHVSSIDMLIARGANVEAKDSDGGMTALMYASYGCHVSSIDMLIARGADINAKDYSGMTALMYAYSGGHSAAADALKRHEATTVKRCTSSISAYGVMEYN
jgi:serine/threonine-protein phosphatase 6 regulatory ankyrin repeat subunit B